MKLRLKAKIAIALILGVSISTGLYLEKISRIEINQFYYPDNRIVFDKFEKHLRWFPEIKGERPLWISIGQNAGKTKKAFIAA